MSESEDLLPTNRAGRRPRAAKKRGKTDPHGGVSEPADLPDHLQHLALIWEPQLAELLQRSRFTIRRWVSQGKIPPPIRMTEQGLAWRVRDIEHALDRLARSRKKPRRRGALMQGKQLVKEE